MKEKIIMIVVGILLIALLFFGVKFSIEEQKEWEAFKIIHKCKVVSSQEGYSSPVSGVGVGMNGKVGVVFGSTYTPEKTTWLCDDNVTYTR